MGWMTTARPTAVSARPEPDGVLRGIASLDRGAIKPDSGLWSVLEADIDADSDASHPAVWLQVGINPLRMADVVVTHPVMVCADDALQALGKIQLHGMQVMFPDFADVFGSMEDETSLRSSEWFMPRSAGADVTARLTISAGPGTDVASLLPLLGEWLQDSDQDVFRPSLTSTEEHAVLLREAPFYPQHMWEGAAPEQITLTGNLARWSLDALGWTIGLIASRLGGLIEGPVMITAEVIDTDQ